MKKDPDANLPFSFDWTTWLTNEGDTADSFEWTVPAGLTKGAETSDEGVATVWLSGGTNGTAYVVTCRITTTGGRTDDRSRTIEVRHR